MEREPQYGSIIDTLIQGKQKESDSSPFGTLHTRFWKAPDTFESSPSNLNTWLNAGKVHFQAQPGPNADIEDDGYHPPMIRTVLEGISIGQRTPSNDPPTWQDFENHPTPFDFSDKCHFLDTFYTVNDLCEILYIREEYIRAEKLIEEGDLNVYLVLGSSGAGKSGFMRYLLHRLLRDGKPALWYTTNLWYLFCSKGVFAIPQNDLTANLLMDENFGGVYLLADANDVNKELPDIFLFHGSFRWTLIYTSSPKDNQVTKALQQNFRSRYKTFIMNPWTLFEIELVTHALRFGIKDFPRWPEIRERIIDFGPLLHELWPSMSNKSQLESLTFPLGRLETCLASIQDPSQMKYAISEATELRNPNSNILFLIFRRKWQSVEEDGRQCFSAHPQICFQSVKVVECVQVWCSRRTKEQQSELMKVVWDVHGFETPFGFMFQTLYINDWLARKLPNPINVYGLTSKSGRDNSKYVCDSTHKAILIPWTAAEPIVQHRIPEMQVGIFYYESFPGKNVPLADAFIADTNRCYALNMTRSKSHDISMSGLVRLIDAMPRGIKNISLIHVLPRLRRIDFELSSAQVDEIIEVANVDHGKVLEILVADHPLAHEYEQ